MARQLGWAAANADGSHLANSTAKLTRYNWTMVDEPGELEWLAKEDLHISEEYQRTLTEVKVKAIASEWSWLACGALIVAQRAGINWVVDGQHRLAAARKRSDIDLMPCIVFETEEVKTEAKGFLGANTFRKPLTALQRFRALLISDDPAALLLDQYVNGSGYTLSSTTTPGSKTVKCVTCLLEQIRQDPDLFGRLWPLYVEIAGKGPIMERVVEGIWYIERNQDDDTTSLLRQPWRRRVVALGSTNLLAAAHRAAAFYEGGGAKVWATGILQAINKGVRNRLVVATIGEGRAE